MAMRIELTTAEHELLAQILEERFRELMLEIRHAHHHREFRDALRQREKLLEGIIEKLGVLEKAG
jgi:hypothetical protein